MGKTKSIPADRGETCPHMVPGCDQSSVSFAVIAPGLSIKHGPATSSNHSFAGPFVASRSACRLYGTRTRDLPTPKLACFSTLHFTDGYASALRGGGGRTRTDDLLGMNQAGYQLPYSAMYSFYFALQMYGTTFDISKFSHTFFSGFF